MKGFFFCFFFTLLATPILAQVHLTKLVIQKHETYSLEQSDILVADTLIMMDSSTIVLNKLKKENYIRSQVVIIGKNCMIDGSGLNGRRGRDGRNGDTPIGPCKSGENGRNGSRGLDGGYGIDLFFYVTNLQIKGRLTINLSGGNGGHGGNGGNGGGGSPGTLHCTGGNGGNGGGAGNGGNGGSGGTLSINCVKCPNIRAMIGKALLVLNAGGGFGFGGVAGYGGPPGLGPSRRNGTTGDRGIDGSNGRSGERGTINFDVD